MMPFSVKERILLGSRRSWRNFKGVIERVQAKRSKMAHHDRILGDLDRMAEHCERRRVVDDKKEPRSRSVGDREGKVAPRRGLWI